MNQQSRNHINPQNIHFTERGNKGNEPTDKDKIVIGELVITASFLITNQKEGKMANATALAKETITRDILCRVYGDIAGLAKMALECYLRRDRSPQDNTDLDSDPVYCALRRFAGLTNGDICIEPMKEGN